MGWAGLRGMGRISWARWGRPCGLGWTEQAERDGLSGAGRIELGCYGLDMGWARASVGWTGRGRLYGLGWSGQAKGGKEEGHTRTRHTFE